MKRTSKNPKRNPTKWNETNKPAWLFIENLMDVICCQNVFEAQVLIPQALVYIQQGLICNDCDKNFRCCYCEKCDDCLSQRCICDLRKNSTLLEYKIYAFKLGKKHLNKKDFGEFLYKLKWSNCLDAQYLLLKYAKGTNA